MPLQLFALVLIVLSCSVFPVMNEDIGRHLAEGNFILATHSIPTVEHYSFSAAGTKVIDHWWLSEVIFAKVYGWAGYNGLIVLKVALVLIACFFLLKTCELFGEIRTLALLLTGFAIFTISSRLLVRPLIFSYPLFTAALYVLLAYRQQGKNYLPVLPLIIAFWANLYGGVIFGVALIVGFAALEWVKALTPSHWVVLRPSVMERQSLIRLSLYAAASLAATLVNPQTYRLLALPFALTGYSYGQGIPIFRYVFEYSSPFAPPFLLSFVFFLVAIWVFAVPLAFYAVRRVDITLLGIWVVFLYEALTWQRNFDIFVLCSVPIVFQGLESARRAGYGRWLAEQPAKASAVLWGVALLCVTFISVVGYPLHNGANRKPGLGVYVGLPVHALEFMNNNGIEGNIYNHYNFGGSIIHACSPKSRVYIDGRMEAYFPEILQEAFRAESTQTGFDAIVRKYPIDAILIPPPDNSLVHQFLVSHPEFALVYFDETAFVYVRRTPDNAQFLQSNEYRFLTPHLERIDQHADQFIVEAKRAIAQNQATFMPYFVLGLAYESKGERQLAHEAYQQAKSISPKYPPLLAAIKRLGLP